ncbi:MAG: hypothetical protein KME20_05470 [Kaiparowitsia implicata GSE-PSE-MK54-09C]|jgi:hypothetical protein|nr:hypothetical protein [Kaiparowitsia implicata GSE-PSE-MK54-09C]
MSEIIKAAMTRRRWFAFWAVCLVCGQAASWGLIILGMFGFLPGLLIGTALLYWIIPTPDSLEA